MAGLTLGCFEKVPLKSANLFIPLAGERATCFRNDPFAMREYGRAREIVVGQKVKRTTTTLHRVLWGRPKSGPLNQWSLRPWETPALGLPTAIAIRLFIKARKAERPSESKVAHVPRNWAIDDEGGLLAWIRCKQFGRQFGLTNGSAPSYESFEKIEIKKTPSWEILAHETYYLPFTALNGEDESKQVHAKSYTLYCDVLLLLTALDGRETILDELARQGAGTRSFEDRWDWRSRIHLNSSSWENIEEILRWSQQPDEDITGLGTDLSNSLRCGTVVGNPKDDTVIERIDINLLVADDTEFVHTISPFPQTNQLQSTEFVSSEDLASDFVVRVAQVTAWPERSDIVARFPAIKLQTISEIMQQVASAFTQVTESSVRPELVLLPESTIPQSQVSTVRNLVRRTGIASLAGIYWRRVHPAYRPAGQSSASWKCFVNEAELVVPEGHQDRGPTTIRWFRVRKPVPAHIEDGLASELTAEEQNVEWSVLPGHRWYRFIHPRWGDFSVAICADLIDSEPWRSLRGKLLHLLMVAFNPDVELFEALTWVRAYENYVNMASVNHGKYGGSFVWTPQHGHSREVAKLRGGKLFLTADVRLPVKTLLDKQRSGVDDSVESAAVIWQGGVATKSEFKSPPPGFEPRES